MYRPIRGIDLYIVLASSQEISPSPRKNMVILPLHLRNMYESVLGRGSETPPRFYKNISAQLRTTIVLDPVKIYSECDLTYSSGVLRLRCTAA